MKISTKEISSTIAGKDILKNISVQAEGKKFIGILGPNGSGKSTLLKCIYRTLKPSGGMIELDDRELSHISIKESAKKMAVVAQHSHYSFDFNVSEVVLMGRSPHKKLMERDTEEDYRIVDEALAAVDMLEFRERSFSTLSGGEQQRIILARALAQKTECMILDEPTNHLDIKYQLQLLDIVKSLNITTIAAIHDLNIASMYCDYLYILKEGEIVCEGVPAEVLTPQIIKEVYEVDAEVIYDKHKIAHILYRPMHL